MSTKNSKQPTVSKCYLLESPSIALHQTARLYTFKWFVVETGTKRTDARSKRNEQKLQTYVTNTTFIHKYLKIQICRWDGQNANAYAGNSGKGR